MKLCSLNGKDKYAVREICISLSHRKQQETHDFLRQAVRNDLKCRVLINSHVLTSPAQRCVHAAVSSLSKRDSNRPRLLPATVPYYTILCLIVFLI